MFAVIKAAFGSRVCLLRFGFSYRTFPFGSVIFVIKEGSIFSRHWQTWRIRSPFQSASQGMFRAQATALLQRARNPELFCSINQSVHAEEKVRFHGVNVIGQSQGLQKSDRAVCIIAVIVAWGIRAALPELKCRFRAPHPGGRRKTVLNSRIIKERLHGGAGLPHSLRYAVKRAFS